MMNLKEQLAANLVSSPQLILPTKAHQSTSPPCIDNGRVLLHDSPYPAGMAAPYLSRFGGLGQPVYSTSPMTPNGLTVEPSAFYPLGGMIPSLYGRSEEMWKNMEHPGLGFGSPVDHMLASAHPYGAFYGGIDLNNAARRKNATRETTSALKAWLYEHRKNPYPTKGEKIMLAIITKMTLTQVSTWFANARRRLKKESKLGYKDRDVDDSDVESIGSPCDREDEKDRNGSLSSNQLDDEDDDIDVKVTSDISDISDVESEADVLRFGESKRKFFKSASEGDNIKSEDGNQNQTSGQNIAARLSPPNGLNVDNLNRASSSNTRSRIWSIDEIISKCESSPRTETACSKNIVPSLLSNTSPRQNIPFTRIVDAPVCSSAHAQNKISSETKTSLKEPPQLFSTNSHSDVALNLAISDKRGLTHPRIETSEKTLIQAESNNSS